MADPLSTLVKLLCHLPGIGEKTATRLAFHILNSPASYAQDLAAALIQVKERLCQCSTCFHLTENDPCAICSDPRRDSQCVCVVALSQDLLALERTRCFHGKYHVLHGVLSPLDGIGPADLKIQPLLARIHKDAVKEVILATSPNVEGDATALYLSSLIRPLGVRTTRIASGLPIGGDLEYADGVTLSRAFENRRDY